MSESSAPWASWFPPGLDPEVAAEIGNAHWADDPHLASALAWESYAASLPPTPSVASVNTGAQSVTYSPAGPVGEYGAALARAQWHRTFGSSMASIPLGSSIALERTYTPEGAIPDPDGGCWWPEWWLEPALTWSDPRRVRWVG